MFHNHENIGSGRDSEPSGRTDRTALPTPAASSPSPSWGSPVSFLCESKKVEGQHLKWREPAATQKQD